MSQLRIGLRAAIPAGMSQASTLFDFFFTLFFCAFLARGGSCNPAAASSSGVVHMEERRRAERAPDGATKTVAVMRAQWSPK